MQVAVNGDWYFIHPLLNTPEGKTIIFPVAVWSENKNGDWIGLIGNVESKRDNACVTLVSPPPVEGMYIKRNPVNSEMIDKALSNKSVDYSVLREL